jgi:hypothetical protein
MRTEKEARFMFEGSFNQSVGRLETFETKVHELSTRREGVK